MQGPRGVPVDWDAGVQALVHMVAVGVLLRANVVRVQFQVGQRVEQVAIRHIHSHERQCCPDLEQPYISMLKTLEIPKPPALVRALSKVSPCL